VLRFALGLEQLKFRAGVKTKQIDSRKRSALALQPNDRHPAANEAVFLAREFSLSMTGDQQIHLQVGLRSHLLHPLQALVKRCDYEVRLFSRLPRGAEQLTILPCYHHCDLKTVGWEQPVGAVLLVREPKAFSKLNPTSVIQLTDGFGL